MTRRATIPPGVAVEFVTAFARWENSMAGPKEDPVVFVAFAEVETTGALEVKMGFGSDSETGVRE